MSSMGSQIGGAMGSRKAGHKARDDGQDYRRRMTWAVGSFMKTFTGDAPAGFETPDQFATGEATDYKWETRFKKIPIGAMKMKKAGINQKDIRALKKMDTIGEQEGYLSDILGHPVTLDELYTRGGSLKMRAATTSEYGTFESLDEIRALGGKPSIEQQYMPWIKPGQDAYTALTKAVIDGDMSGFFTSPGYAFRLAEGEKAITRLANAGKIPTAQAHKGLIEHGQGLASNEYGSYLNRLGGIATTGYSALQDLKSLEAYYKGSELSTMSGVNANLMSQGNLAGQYLQQGYQQGGAAIGSGLQMMAGGMGGSSGGGGMSSMGSSMLNQMGSSSY